MQNLGSLSTLRLDEETSYGGSKETLNNALIRFNSSTLTETMTPLDDPSLLGTRSYYSWKHGSRAVAGDIVTNLKTRNQGYFFKHLLGQYRVVSKPEELNLWLSESIPATNSPNPPLLDITDYSAANWDPLCKLLISFDGAPSSEQTVTIIGDTGENGDFETTETITVPTDYTPDTKLESTNYYYNIDNIQVSGYSGSGWPNGATQTTCSGYRNDKLYEHKFVLTEELPSGMNYDEGGSSAFGKNGLAGGDAVTSLSLEICKGGTKAWLYDGIKIDTATITLAAPDLLSATFSLIGQKSSAGDVSTDGTPAAVDNELYAFHSVSITDTNGNTIFSPQPISMDITIDNGLRTDKYVLGSDTIEQTYPNAIRSVTGTIHKQFANYITDGDPLEWWNAFRSEEYLDFKVLIKNYGAYDVPTESIIINLPRVRIEAGDLDVPGPEELEHDIPFRALRTAAGANEIEIIMKNTDAGYPESTV